MRRTEILFGLASLLFLSGCFESSNNLKSAGSSQVPIATETPVDVPALLSANLKVDSSGNIGLGTDSPGARFHVEANSGATDTAVRISSPSSGKSLIQFFNSSSATGWLMGYDQTATGCCKDGPNGTGNYVSCSSSAALSTGQTCNEFYFAHSNYPSTKVAQIYPSANPTFAVNGTLKVKDVTSSGTVDATGASIAAKRIAVSASSPNPAAVGFSDGEVRADIVNVTQSASIAGNLTVGGTGSTLTVNSGGSISASNASATFSTLTVSGTLTSTGALTAGGGTVTIDTSGNITQSSSTWRQIGADHWQYSSTTTTCTTNISYPSSTALTTANSTAVWSGTITIIKNNGAEYLSGIFAGTGSSTMTVNILSNTTLTAASYAPSGAGVTLTGCTAGQTYYIYIDAFVKP